MWLNPVSLPRMRRFCFVAVSAVLLVFGLAPQALAQSTDWDQVVDLTFPTEVNDDISFIDDFHYPRGNDCGIHRATDIMGPQWTELYATVDGTITHMPLEEPHYGYTITISGDDGRDYVYIHLNNKDRDGNRAGPEVAYAPGLAEGDRVERGQHVGYMGHSGNATEGADHLHLEIQQDDVEAGPHGCPGYINPYYSLTDALERGDVPGGDPDPDPGPDPDPEPAPPVEDVVLERVGAADRVGTSVVLSEESFAAADHVVVASGWSYSDAVVAGPLASAHGAPVLSTHPGQLDERIADEVARLGASQVTIVGGEGAVEADVANELEAITGVTEVTRVAGASASETAALIADEVRVETGTTGALVALGAHSEPDSAWPDALAAAAHGAVSGQPILLVGEEALPAATHDALDDAESATLIGGTGAISAAVEAEIDAHVNQTVRLEGRDRYETATAVADDLLAQGSIDAGSLWPATGHDFADALAAAPAVAASGGVFTLIDGTDSGGDGRIDPWLAGLEGVASVHVIGGTAAVSESASQGVVERLSGS